MSISSIADAIKRSKSAVGSYIKNKNCNNGPIRSGPVQKLSSRAKNLLVRSAQVGRKTARTARDESGLSVFVRTVQRVLQQAEHLEFGPLKKRPALTKDHRKERFRWAREFHFQPARLWKKTVFTDEKRFCLDGPDGQAYFWADKRLPRDIFAKPARGGGCVMVWAGIS